MKAIVTGSSRGLGFAISKKFLEEGIDVAVSSRNEASLTNTLEKLKSINQNAQVIGQSVDFGDRSSVKKYVNYVLNEWQSVDLLVNNVGIYFGDQVDEDIEDNLEKVLNVNLFSSVRINNAVLDVMKRNKKGTIINIISIAAKNLRADAATYSISKLALQGYNDLLREKLKPIGIRVVALYPDAMNTSSWDDEDVNKSKMIQMADMTSIVMNVINMTDHATVDEIIINTSN